MYILFYNSNSSKKNFIFTCPETTWRPVAPEPGGQIQNFFYTRKSQKETFFCKITYPLTPRTKPIITIFAKVSELHPPPPETCRPNYWTIRPITKITDE